MQVTISCGSTQIPFDVSTITKLGEFRDFIAQENELDRDAMKILHRGKILSTDDEIAIESVGFKEGDKVIVMGGKKMAIKDDPGFSALLQYEKHNLNNLQKTFDELSKDLTELEKGYLEKPKQIEMIKKFDKRLKQFNEESERHLESIDGIQIIRENTPENQVKRNREKRKTLISGVQDLLNQNDKFVKRLEEYEKKLMGEIVE
ncbi:unnamed protein product [Caenorhabditis angaria]|uniref:BAG family molecular chaperone regulator 1 n=1 Tax=Caenorhabditis angaria TaxID=860376 RepID=A0A9P1I6H8_9PELO|nr:unnamed protein product [Caenorhabditis angaria]